MTYKTKPTLSAKPFPSPAEQAAKYEAFRLGLTRSQKTYLAEIRAAPNRTRRYTGGATKPLTRLEALGLITVDWDADLDATKSRLRWRLTARAVEGKP